MRTAAIWQVKTHIFAMGVAVFVGMANGLMGALFTSINLKFTTLRAKLIGPVRWKRLLEPIVYMFIFASLSMVLPYAFPCKESDCYTDSGAPHSRAAEAHMACAVLCCTRRPCLTILHTTAAQLAW